MSEATPDRLLTKAELAQRLRCGLRTIDRRVGDGTLPPPIKALGRRLWRAVDVEKHLRARTLTARPLKTRITDRAGAIERDLVQAVRAARQAGEMDPDSAPIPDTLPDIALLASCIMVLSYEILDSGIQSEEQIFRFIRGVLNLSTSIVAIYAPPETYAAQIADSAEQIAAALRHGITDQGHA